MYRDTEQSYRGYCLDVYETTHGWQVDFHVIGDGRNISQILTPRRKESVKTAKRIIDNILSAPTTTV